MARLAESVIAYQRRLTYLLDCLTRVDVARSRRELRAFDVDLLYESTFLASVALFEAMLEDILIEAVCGPRGAQPGSYALVKPRSRERFRTILRRGRPYVDLMPFDRALELAGFYVNGAMPFGAVPTVDRTLLREVVLTRNAIAHRSEAASRSFRNDVPGVGGLSRNRQRPGPFLQSIYRATPRQSRTDLYLGALGRISGDLLNAW